MRNSFRSVTLPASIGWSVLMLAGLLPFGGCVQSTTDPADRISMVDLSFQGLEPLKGGLKYQAWAVTRRSGLYQGLPFLVFNVNEAGALVDPVQDTVLTGPFQLTLAADAVYGIAVSLEITEGSFVSDSYSYLLGGVVEGKAADLELAPWLGLNMNLSGMAGWYVLGTPTDGDPQNEEAGIWFLDGSGPGPVPGLNLPDVEPGWNYEGWVVVGSDTLSTGKFSTAAGPDLSNRHSGERPAPAFPGEDFLSDPPENVTFPLHLPGASVFVTLEPWNTWDTEPQSPFFLRLLEGEVPQAAVPGRAYELTSLFDHLPRGTAFVRKP